MIKFKFYKFEIVSLQDWEYDIEDNKDVKYFPWKLSNKFQEYYLELLGYNTNNIVWIFEKEK